MKSEQPFHSFPGARWLLQRLSSLRKCPKFPRLAVLLKQTLSEFLLLFSCYVMSDSVTSWTAACQASLSFTVSQSLLRLMSVESVMPSNHLILCCPLLLLPSIFLTSESFPMSQLFETCGQSTRASASVLLMNIQDWLPLGLIGLIFLLSKRLSRVFSSMTVQKHQFFGTQPSLWSNWLGFT